jgi:hypothetical protein
MLEEVYSERNQLADDGTLSKILFYDIVLQLRHSAGPASVDANNCYNRIAHPMASMVFQLFGVPTPAIESILRTIQDMKFYLRTGYGDSTGYAGGSNDPSGVTRKTQGMCQGNGAAPAAWSVMSIPMIAALLGRCRHCSGNYEARGASGGKYEARIVIFRILAAVDRFSRISQKAESRQGKSESR